VKKIAGLLAWLPWLNITDAPLPLVEYVKQYFKAMAEACVGLDAQLVVALSK
jgi:hypothetical protein